MQFTYRWYKRLIRTIDSQGYRFASYHDYDRYQKCVILRHDIDFSPEKALELAKIEKDLGVISTYFLLLSTDFYNPASKRCLEIITEIQNLGHEIGLHFDEAKYETYGNSIVNNIGTEIEVLSFILNVKIKCVSMHRPSKPTLDADYKVKDAVNSYSKQFFNEFKYVSDSRMFWREDIETIIASNEHKRVHLLTHPIWYNDEEKSMNQIIADYVNSANLSRYQSMFTNIKDLNEIMKFSEVVR